MTVPASVLNIDIRQEADYQADISDPSLFATVPAPTTPNTPRNFFVVTLIGDIRFVNGQPAKGTYVGRTRVIKAGDPAPPLGGALTDVTRTAMREHIFEILHADGSQIGTIMSTGFSGGQAPPGTGAPQDGKGGNWAIVGGTGAYLGARGQLRGTGHHGRAASMTEDPGTRRNIQDDPDNYIHFILHLIPMDSPEIMTAAAGPLIFHHNFTLVTPLTPAFPHQDLLLFATGLGPTRPDVDLAQPFPLAPPPSVVNSPLTVTVNGVAAQNVHAVGVPGAVNGYQVKFRMPDTGLVGPLPIRLSAAWIDGPPSTIWASV